MNQRRERTFALYFLVKVVGFGYRESAMSIDNGGFALYQLDEIAEAGVYYARMSEDQAEQQLKNPQQEVA